LNFLKEVKKFSIATIVVSAIVGLLFIFFPAQCIKYTSLFVGIALIAIGVVAIVSYIADKSGTFSLLMGIIILICGIVICVKYKAIISLIVIIFGIFILASGIVDLSASIRSIIRFSNVGWFTLVLSIVTIILGIIAITKSGQLTEGIIQFIGVALIVYAVLDIISYIQVNKLAKKIKEATDSLIDIDTDGTIAEDIDE
jgi:uncharacterized membrane protein HdeD (DUF308 family)